MKKIIALLTLTCLLFSCVPVFADDTAIAYPLPSTQEFTTKTFPGEVIFPYTETTGEWKTSNAIPGYKGKHIYSSTAGCTVTYPISGISAGNYEAYFWTMPHGKSAAETTLLITHNGKTDSAAIYSKTNGEEMAPGWVSFGIYDFKGDGTEKVLQVANDKSDRASGIKLVPTKKDLAPGTKPLSPLPGTESVVPETPAVPEQPKEDTAPSVSYPDPTTQVFSTDKKTGEIVVLITEQIGSWRASNAVKAYSGKHIWTQTAGDYVTYKPEALKKGNYEVYYWAMPYGNNENETVIDIYHSGKKSSAAVYTRCQPETLAPGWVSLGVYDFSGTDDEKVMQICKGETVRANAVKFVPTTNAVKPGATPLNDITVAPVTPAPVTPTPTPEVPVQPEDTVEKIDANAEVTLVPALSASSKAKSIVVGSVGECTWTGDWRFSTAALSPMARAQQTIYAMSAKDDATVTYKPQFETAGNVRVSVYGVYYKSDLVNHVKYEVHHNGKTEEFHIDLSKLTESKWVTLGTFDFKGDKDNEFVKLICTGANGNMRASTVMFETLNAAGDAVENVAYVTPDVDLNAVKEENLKKLAPLNKFSDMTGHWASYDVEYMANEGLISGVSEDKFNPDAQITRAEYLTILDRAMGYAEVKEDFFPDVTSDTWYYGYVGAAKKNGLTEGLPTDDGFKPTQPISREEMALFTYNAIKAIGKNDEWLSDLPDDYAKFTDVAEVSDWAKEAMQYFVHTGIIKGMTETTVAPKGNATRAQGAVILKRFMQMFVWAGPPADKEWVMTFNDEFTGDSLDWSIWRSQANTATNLISRWPENAVVKDGSLHLVIKKNDNVERGWTSGNVWVRPEVFRQSYGYWEARYKITDIPYANNSFWTHSGLVALPEVTDDTLKYEQDVNEGKYPNFVDVTYHHYKNGHEKDHIRVESEYDLSKDYHTYALEWTPEEMVFYFDGEEVLRCPNLDHIPVYPLLSSAIMTNCGEMRNYDADGKAQIIDYVRIWQTPENVNNKEITMIGEVVENLGAADPHPNEYVKPVVEENK